MKGLAVILGQAKGKGLASKGGGSVSEKLGKSHDEDNELRTSDVAYDEYCEAMEADNHDQAKRALKAFIRSVMNEDGEVEPKEEEDEEEGY